MIVCHVSHVTLGLAFQHMTLSATICLSSVLYLSHFLSEPGSECSLHPKQPFHLRQCVRKHAPAFHGSSEFPSRRTVVSVPVLLTVVSSPSWVRQPLGREGTHEWVEAIVSMLQKVA